MKSCLLAVLAVVCLSLPVSADAYSGRPSRAPFWDRAYAKSDGRFLQAVGVFGRSGAFSGAYPGVVVVRGRGLVGAGGIRMFGRR